MTENAQTNLFVKMEIVTPVTCGLFEGYKTEEINFNQPFVNKLEALKAIGKEITKLIAKEHGVLK